MKALLVAYRKFYALDEAFAWLGIHIANVSLVDTVDSVIRIPTLEAPQKRNGWAILFSDGKVLCGNEELPDRKALVYPANSSSKKPKFALTHVGEESVALEGTAISKAKLRIGFTSNAIKNQNRSRKVSFLSALIPLLSASSGSLVRFPLQNTGQQLNSTKRSLAGIPVKEILHVVFLLSYLSGTARINGNFLL